MKNQNTVKPTQEEKARFFAQYIRQPVYVNNNWDKFDGSIAHLDATYLIIGSNGLNEGFLKLTPLSDITDEDAIEVGIICGYSRLRPDIVTIGKAIAFEKAYSGIITKMSAIIDFIRSKGYALPFIGYSVQAMQDFGWLKLKQKGGEGE